jgi:DNA-binding HxlR family transcriptional regulator
VIGHKEALYDQFYVARVIRLTAEHVQIHIVGFLAEMGRDVRRFNQLNKRESGLVTTSKILNRRRPIRNHVNLVD